MWNNFCVFFFAGFEVCDAYMSVIFPCRMYSFINEKKNLIRARGGIFCMAYAIMTVMC